MIVQMTKRQKEALRKLKEDGFIECKTSFGNSQANRPLWKLVSLGLADFGFGPKGSFLKTQGFFPINHDKEN